MATLAHTCPYVNSFGSTRVEVWHTADHVGWLERQGDILGLWRQRYFVLKCGTLFWFDDAVVTTASAARGKLNIGMPPSGGPSSSGVVVEVTNADVKMKRPALALKLGSGKEKFFIAGSPQERDAWIEAIKATLERARALNVLYERETLTTRLLMREKICVEGAAYKERLFDWGRRKPKMRCCSLITLNTSAIVLTSGSGTGSPTAAAPKKVIEDAVVSVTLVDPKRCALPLATSSAARAALCGVMESIRHQFVLPVLKCVTTVSNEGDARVGVLRGISKKGSLRDRLHKVSNPKLCAWDKYYAATRSVAASSPFPTGDADGSSGSSSMPPEAWRSPTPSPKGLPIAEVRQRSRQVLEALLYLRQRRIRMIHLHIGNVIVRDKDDASCLVDVVENMILNLPCEADALVPQYLENERSSYYETECLYSFGRFMYHIVAGCQPGRISSTAVPDAVTDESVPTEVRSILASMLLPFQVAAEVCNNVRLDTLEDVVSSFPFFSDEQLSVDVRFINARAFAGNEKKLLSKVYDNAVAEEEKDREVVPLDHTAFVVADESNGDGSGGSDSIASPSSTTSTLSADTFDDGGSQAATPGAASGPDSLAAEEQKKKHMRRLRRESKMMSSGIGTVATPPPPLSTPSSGATTPHSIAPSPHSESAGPPPPPPPPAPPVPQAAPKAVAGEAGPPASNGRDALLASIRNPGIRLKKVS